MSMRLTKKDITNIYENKTFMLPRIAGKKLTTQILNEMVEYKTIEEELGIDLLTLFKALNNPIYIKENYDGTFVDETLWCSNCIICGVGEPIIEVGNYGVYPKDYGKTWALTREKLEK